MLKLKWAGIFSIAAGLLTALSWVLELFLHEEHTGTMYFITTLSDQLGMILFIFTLFGLYLVYHDTAKGYTFISFVISVVGTAFFAGEKWISTFVLPFLYQKAPEVLKTDPVGTVMVGMNVSFLLFGIGVILVGISLIIGKTLPKYTGVILVLAPIVDFIPAGNFSLGQIVFAVAVFLIGLSLAKQKVEFKEP